MKLNAEPEVFARLIYVLYNASAVRKAHVHQQNSGLQEISPADGLLPARS